MNEIIEFESIFTEHILSGHLEKALNLGLSFFKSLDNDDIYNEFLNLSSRFEHLRDQNRQGIISLSEYDLLRNRIGHSAVELIMVYIPRAATICA